MVWLCHIPVALVTLLLLCPAVFSLPQQIILRPSDSAQGPASDIVIGDDIQLLLRRLSDELDLGLPSNWERLVHPPQTSGTSRIEVIHPQDLEQVLGGWGIEQNIRSQALEDVKVLVNMHAPEAVYVSQRFTYNKPGCQGGDLPVCTFTLIVAARQVNGSEQSDAIEIGHLYIQSTSTAIQQMFPSEECHRCWFSRCCHTRYYPRDFTTEELNDIQTVLSTNQVWWAYDNMPEALAEMTNGLDVQPLPLRELLRQFVNNKDENKDVYKKYDEGILGAIRNSTSSSRKNVRSMTMSLKKEDFVGILDSLLSPCLRKTTVNETAQELWRRLYNGHRNVPLSLECETISQIRERKDSPTNGCNKPTIVTTETRYSWLLASPRADLLDCIFISNDVEISHLECERLPDGRNNSSNNPSRRLSHCLAGNDTSSESEGSIVRWSILHPGGFFFPVHYLAQWALYPIEINKAITDIMRYASGTAYLRIPLSKTQDLVPVNQDIDVQEISADLASLGNSLAAFAAGWEKFANAFKTTVTETVKRKVCLGFTKYEHTVKSFYAKDINQVHLPEVVDSLLNIALAPFREDLKNMMLLIKYSTNFTWAGETASYTSDNGFHSFFYFFKQANETTKDINIVFGMLTSDFTIAPDVLIVNKKKSVLGGIYQTDETFYRNVPHVITPNDTALLNVYFEMVAYRQLALVTGLPIPDYPNLGYLCDFNT